MRIAEHFQIYFSQGARKAIIRTAVSGSTGSPPPLQKIKSNFPPNKKLGIKSKN
jgi:hypothetical protein